MLSRVFNIQMIYQIGKEIIMQFPTYNKRKQIFLLSSYKPFHKATSLFFFMPGIELMTSCLPNRHLCRSAKLQTATLLFNSWGKKAVNIIQLIQFFNIIHLTTPKPPQFREQTILCYFNKFAC